MDSAKVAPFIGRHPGKVLVSAAAVAVLGVAVAASTRQGAKVTAAPSPVAVVTDESAGPHPDIQLASQQAAFAMSHLGTMRDEAELEAPAPAASSAAEKPRAASQRPGSATKPVGQVAGAPLPPVPAPRQTQAAKSDNKPDAKPAPSIFGVTLPSPGKWVDRVASLGDSLTSLVRWR